MRNKLKVFISLKVPRGNAELEMLADLTADLVRQAGCQPFVATHEIAARDLDDPKAFMPFARQHAEISDLMIVLYHSELRGGLIEMGIAYAKDIPIWLCYKMPSPGYKYGQSVSSSALGCADLEIEYQNLDELITKLTVNLRHFLLTNKKENYDSKIHQPPLP